MVDMQSPSSDVYMFDTDISPPGTPSSTPKTPELNVPTVVEQKRKKKEKSGKKKEPKLKSPKQCVSPKKVNTFSYVIALCFYANTVQRLLTEETVSSFFLVLYRISMVVVISIFFSLFPDEAFE